MPKIHHIKLLYFMRRLKRELHDHFLHPKCIKKIQCKFGDYAQKFKLLQKKSRNRTSTWTFWGADYGNRGLEV